MTIGKNAGMGFQGERMDFKTVNIFISSSFNDMHAERDYLVQYVFEELREWCEKRKLYLNDIDLRWGVTSADSESKNTVRVCLRNIDECRPFFLCFLGQRRGAVFGSEGINDETFDEYPELSEIADKYSATELEVEHALLAPMLTVIKEREERPEKVRRALFFLRKDPFADCDLSYAHRLIYTNAGAADPQATEEAHRQFREEVRQNCPKTIDYSCRFDLSKTTPELKDYGMDDDGVIPPEKQGAAMGRLCDFTVNGIALKDVLLDELKRMILAEYPDRSDESLRTPSTAEIHQLLRSRFTRFFIRRDEVFEQLFRYLDSDMNTPLLLSAKSGAGKSALLSNFCDEVKDRRVIMRFCGVSADSTCYEDVMRGVFTECGIETPGQDQELFENQPELLIEIAKQGKTLILLDDITRTTEGVGALGKLPAPLPDNIRMIVSMRKTVKTDAAAEILKNTSGNPVITLSDFNADDKRRLTEDFLNQHLKALDNEHIDYICGIRSTDNPLYLKIILSELRTFGAFSQLRSEIQKFGTSPVNAFTHLLERLEEKIADAFPEFPDAVGNVMGLLAFSRAGVRKSDLITAMRLIYHKSGEHCVFHIIRGVREYLSGVVYADADSRVDFLYDGFKRAVADRYQNGYRIYHGMLALLFEETAPEECSYHLRVSDSRDQLTRIYADPSFILRFVRQYGGWRFAREALEVEEKLLPPGLTDCTRLCAQALTNHPDQTPEILYKEVSDLAFRSRAKDLIQKPWLRFEKNDAAAPHPDDDAELVPKLENKRVMDAVVSARCFAPSADYAFLFTGLGKVSVYRMSTVEFLYDIPIDCDTPVKLCCSGDGAVLMVVNDDYEVSVYELVLSPDQYFIKKTVDDSCIRIRFQGPCAYGYHRGVIWQTSDDELKTYTRSGLQTIDTTDERLCGAWEFNKLILAFKSSNGCTLRTDDNFEILPYRINDIALKGDKLIVAVKEPLLYVLDARTLRITEKIPCDNPVFRMAKSKGRLFGTDEDFNLVCITSENKVHDLGKINFYDGSVHTNTFEHICSADDELFYSSDTVCARLEVHLAPKGSAVRPAERFLNAVSDEKRQEVYETFEGRFKSCDANGVTYRIAERNILRAVSSDGRHLGEVRLDNSQSGQYILKPFGEKAVVLTVRTKKEVGFAAVDRSVIAVIDRGTLLFRKEFMPEDNLIDVFTDDDTIWLRGSAGFTVIDCADHYQIRTVPFSFTGISPYSPSVISHGMPVLIRDDTKELLAVSGKSGRILASYPFSREIESLEKGEGELLCAVSERGAGQYTIYPEGFTYID